MVSWCADSFMVTGFLSAHKSWARWLMRKRGNEIGLPSLILDLRWRPIRLAQWHVHWSKETSTSVSTWMGDHQLRPSAVNQCPFVGVDLNMWPTFYRPTGSSHRADTDLKWIKPNRSSQSSMTNRLSIMTRYVWDLNVSLELRSGSFAAPSSVIRFRSRPRSWSALYRPAPCWTVSVAICSNTSNMPMSRTN